MRLRYLHLPKLPPLEDVTVSFGFEPVLGRECALHFIVGVNGSGKSRLLRAIAEIFICLERGIDPPFPYTLIYDLGPGTANVFEPASQKEQAQKQNLRTIYIRYTQVVGEQKLNRLGFKLAYIQPTLHEERRDWESLIEKAHQDSTTKVILSPTQIGTLDRSCLPTTMLAYTSGATSEWEQMFTPLQEDLADIFTLALEKLDPDIERPARDMLEELKWQQRQGETTTPTQPQDLNSLYVEKIVPPSGIFIPPEALRLAVGAVVLKQVIEDFAASEQELVQEMAQARQEQRRMPGLRGILNEIRWLWPVTLTLQLKLPADLPIEQIQRLHLLYAAATTVRGEPDQGDQRTLIFDLQAKPLADFIKLLPPDATPPVNTAQALCQALTAPGMDIFTPFLMFRTLLTLQRQGFLQNLTLFLRKEGIDDLLLYDWLSDGEHLFLGRMALFHLLGEEEIEDSLILLDEPENHFNDYWKREMVDIIDGSLRENPAEVVLSTHSSIALTDAFDTEVVLLQKNIADGRIRHTLLPIHSFGASPTDIMSEVFGTPETVGQRAAEFLDLMLALAVHTEEVEAIWQRLAHQAEQEEDQVHMQETNNRIRALRQAISKSDQLPQVLRRGENQLESLLERSLRSVYWYTRETVKHRDIQHITMLHAFEALYDKLGPGYYRFEFFRLLRQWRNRANAASD